MVDKQYYRKGKYAGQEVIRQARLARGWTQAELAGRVYVSTSTVSHYENGRNLAPWDELYRVLPELEELRK